MHSKHSVVAVFMIVLSALSLAAQDASMKYISTAVSLSLIIWARYTAQTILMASYLLKTRGPTGFRSVHPFFQCMRGMLLLAVTVLGMAGLRYMPLAEFTAIIMLSPVLVTAISSRMSRHEVSWLRWLLVWCGFAGTVIMLRPGSGLFGAAALLPLLATLTYTGYMVLSSRIATIENPYTSQFYTGITGSVAMLPVLAMQGGFGEGTLLDLPGIYLGLLGLICMTGTVAHLLVMMAFSRAHPATLMPFSYAQIGFASILGWLVFDQIPDVYARIGMLIIILCGMATAWLNLRDARRITQQERQPEKIFQRRNP